MKHLLSRSTLFGFPIVVSCGAFACSAAEDASSSATRRSALVATRSVASPPSYWGSSGGGALCATPYNTVGHESSSAGTYPLFLYFVGTGDQYVQAAASEVTQAMAARGFVALSVQYDNGLQLDSVSVLNKAACLYDPNRAQSLVAAACARPNVDCSKGITTSGHSQGAAVAAIAGSYDARVRGSWVVGIAKPPTAWPYELTLQIEQRRLRIVNAERDDLMPSAHDPAVLNQVTGRNCSASPCFNGPNGSGWYIVKETEIENYPDHCWFLSDGCFGAAQLDPVWKNGTQPFSVGPSTDWLLQTNNLGAQAARDLAFEFAGFDVFFPSALQGVYPAGVADWGTASNFTLSGPSGAVTANHVYTGNNASPATGTFTFMGPQGRTLKSITVQNVGTSAGSVTVTVSAVAGGVSTRTDSIPAGSQVTLNYTFPAGKLVTIQSSIGNQLRFRKFVAFGTAWQKVASPGSCPAARLALQAANNNFASARLLNLNTPIEASQSALSSWETFDCLDQGNGQIALRAANGRYASVTPGGPSLQLFANKTTIGANEKFTVYDLGSSMVTLKAQANGQFVSADLGAFGTPINANRATSSSWEQFKVVPRP